MKRRPASAHGAIALGFLVIILITALLLMLPLSSQSGAWTDPLTALFTAVSAVCVTGLVVVDTASHFSVFGRCVILLAIQTGGLGVTTVLALGALMLKKRIGLRQRTLLLESVSALHIGGIVRLVRRALLGTLIIECAGTLLLSIRFVPMLGLARGLGYALFHAVSAFCNAGFDLMGTAFGPYTSLEAFVSDPLVCLTVMALIVLGGLGFFVWDDLCTCRFRFRKLHLHSRAVLLLTPGLVLLPAGFLLLCEHSHAFAAMNAKTRLIAALFSSVTARTAGFNTVPMDALSPAGSLLTALLMLVGGNPGSTAGGMKTTTLLVVFLTALYAARREEDVHLLSRRLPDALIRRACAIAAAYLIALAAALLALLCMQPDLPFLPAMLEVFSALNTVGLSTGITRALTPGARFLLIALMYSGRLGSLTLSLLIAPPSRQARVRRPPDRLLVG